MCQLKLKFIAYESVLCHKSIKSTENYEQFQTFSYLTTLFVWCYKNDFSIYQYFSTATK